MKKIAILISGNVDDYINKKKLKAGYNFNKTIEILRYQFEKYYDVDYYVVLSHKINLEIFGDRLKEYKILSDTHKRLKSFVYGYKRRQHLKKVIENIDNKNYYHFYMYTRNDRVLVPNGLGLWDRKVKYEQSSGWKKMHMMKKSDYFRRFKFIDDIDLNYIYGIPYGYKQHIDKSDTLYADFCLSNYKNMITFLNFDYQSINSVCRMPEYKTKIHLKNNNLKLRCIDEIIDIPPIDNYLQMISAPGYA